MGDSRYAPFYAHFKGASDKAAALHSLSDDQVIQALAAASRERDPYDANVLATEAMNRMRRSRVITEHLGEGAFAIDRRGMLTFMNPAGAQRLGTRWDALVGRHVVDALPFQDHEGNVVPADALPCMRAMVTCEPVPFEGAFTHIDGSPVAATGVAAPVLIEGQPQGAVVTFRDITERETSRKKIAAIIDALAEGVIILDQGGHVEFANEAAAHMLDMTREELIAADANDARKVWPHTLDGRRMRDDELPSWRALRGESVEGVEACLGPGPDARYVRISGKPLREGGAVVAFDDITKLRRAEREARRRGDLYSAGLETLSQFGEAAMISCNASLEWANDAFFAMLGYMPSEAPGDLREVVHPRDRERVLADITSQVMQGAEPRLHPVTLVRRDGSTVEVVAAVKLIERGPPTTVFALLRPRSPS